MAKFFVFLHLVFINYLNAKNFSDFSYTFSNDGLNKYSASYITNVSTYFLAGVNYLAYDSDDINYVHSIRIPFNYIKNNYTFSVKPFVYFKNDGYSSAGGKMSFGFIEGKEDVFNTYYISISKGWEKKGTKNFDDFIIDISVEKNFYDEFFIMVHGALDLYYDRKVAGRIDYVDMINYGYTGLVNYTVYSNLGFNFARSFKPDFNSYLYLNYDRINGSMDDLNSYLIGLKTFLDEKESYYIDFNYNFADFKKSSNSNFFKISLGVNF